MSSRAATLLIGATILLGLIALGWWLAARDEPEAPAPITDVPESELLPEAVDRVTLYFPGRFGKLWAEERLVDEPLHDRLQQSRVVIGELLRGPQGERLYRPLPPEIEVADVHISPAGVVFVDLASPDRVPPPASGSRDEMLSVYSVVHSILLNVPGTRSVVLLWNGVQRSTFAGHLDTSRPLSLKRDLMGEPAAE